MNNFFIKFLHNISSWLIDCISLLIYMHDNTPWILRFHIKIKLKNISFSLARSTYYIIASWSFAYLKKNQNLDNILLKYDIRYHNVKWTYRELHINLITSTGDQKDVLTTLFHNSDDNYNHNNLMPKLYEVRPC